MFPKIASKQRVPRRPLRQQPLRCLAFLRPLMPRPDSFLLILDKVSFSFLCFSSLSVFVSAFERKKIRHCVSQCIFLEGALNQSVALPLHDSFMTLRRDYYKVKRFVIKLSFFFDLAPRTRCAKRISKFLFG